MSNVRIDRFVEIAIAISKEKDFDKLMDQIINEAMSITGCDGGTLYVYDREKECLHFHNMITRSKGINLTASKGEITLPPVPMGRGHVCACAALDHKNIKIDDIYVSTEYDFHGAQRYDRLNEYRTASMMVIPMEDDKAKVIGVLQLINAQDENGEIIPFACEHEDEISALASLAAVSLNNKQLAQQVLDILHSFVKVMATAIDARSPYNANHTRSMVGYADRFLTWLAANNVGWDFDPAMRDPYLMSVWLHDVGKLVIPLEVMDKATRLGVLEQPLMHKLTVADLMEQIRVLSDPGAAEAVAKKRTMIAEAKELFLSSNSCGFLPDETIERIRLLAEETVQNESGESIPLLNEEELTALTVQKGTLTAHERSIMESHVSYTAKMLSEMVFGGDYEMVPAWAGNHHEFINGSGYPNHLSGEELTKEMRLLTIIDIYDALTAEDRPYKPPMPVEKAFGVLESMAEEGKVDKQILSWFKESKAWTKAPAE